MLSPMELQHVLIYINNIATFLKPPDAHLKHINKVLLSLMEDRATFRLEKCHFQTRGTGYLSFVFAPEKLWVLQGTMEVVQTLRCYTSVSKIRSSSSFCGVYQRLKPDSIRSIAFLNRKMKKQKPFQLKCGTTEGELANILTKKETIQPVPTLPR